MGPHRHLCAMRNYSGHHSYHQPGSQRFILQGRVSVDKIYYMYFHSLIFPNGNGPLEFEITKSNKFEYQSYCTLTIVISTYFCVIYFRIYMGVISSTAY